MGDFTPGQQVRATKTIRDMKEQAGVPEGSVGEFAGYIGGCGAQGALGTVSFPGHVGDGPMGTVRTWDKELDPVQPGPRWSDVEPGDKVTFRVQETGEEFTTTATVGDSRRAAILGLRLGLGLPSNRWELVSIEKPKPQPPTTPGSHVTVPFPGWESGINHLFLLDNGKWASQTGLAFWAAEDVASKDFTVIHDAGAQS